MPQVTVRGGFLLIAALALAPDGWAQGVAQGPPPPPTAKAIKCKDRTVPKFEDLTEKAGIHFSHTSAPESRYIIESMSGGVLLLDYDRDGKLDLFVGNYVEWSADKDLFCTLNGKTKSYCTPESYKGQSPILYHNKGDGTFEDATQRAGLVNPSSKALGVALLDFDGDGWPDLLVANDTQPNKLFRNNGNGTFTDVG